MVAMRARPIVLAQAGATAAVLRGWPAGAAAGGRCGPRTPRRPRQPVTVVIPARDEAGRLPELLAALRADGEARDVLVVDDGSSDDTAQVARAGGARVLTGLPLAEGWAGKAWALQQGIEAAATPLVICLDADTRPRPGLVRALAHELGTQPERTLLTAAVAFRCDTPGERLLHPAFTASLVLRFGPGDVDGYQPPPSRALANGQCLAFRRSALLEAGGLRLVAGSLTEDVALARALRLRGWGLRTVDAAELLEVRMYESLRGTWDGWGRSLMATDATSAPWLAADLLVLWAVQALPLPRLLLRRGTALDAGLLAAAPRRPRRAAALLHPPRLGVLARAARRPARRSGGGSRGRCAARPGAGGGGRIRGGGPRLRPPRACSALSPKQRARCES
jgi:dolichol-phosphate mannosyltransferase